MAPTPSKAPEVQKPPFAAIFSSASRRLPWLAADSAFGPELPTLAGAVVAGGTLVVELSVKKVQHPTGGVVGELLVKEGESRRRGRDCDQARRNSDPRQPSSHRQRHR